MAKLKTYRKTIISFVIRAIESNDKGTIKALEARVSPFPCQGSKEEREAFREAWDDLRHRLINSRGQLISLERLRRLRELCN